MKSRSTLQQSIFPQACMHIRLTAAVATLMVGAMLSEHALAQVSASARLIQSHMKLLDLEPDDGIDPIFQPAPKDLIEMNSVFIAPGSSPPPVYPLPISLTRWNGAASASQNYAQGWVGSLGNGKSGTFQADANVLGRGANLSAHTQLEVTLDLELSTSIAPGSMKGDTATAYMLAESAGFIDIVGQQTKISSSSLRTVSDGDSFAGKLTLIVINPYDTPLNIFLNYYSSAYGKSTTPVPEASTSALTGAGILGILCIASRRRRTAKRPIV